MTARSSVPPELRTWDRASIAAVVGSGLLLLAIIAWAVLGPNDGKQHCYSTGSVVTHSSNGPAFGAVTIEVPCPADAGAP